MAKIKSTSMTTGNSAAKIFLANERGCDETNCYRTYSTFNFAGFHNLNKQAFGRLYVFNNNTLAAKEQLHRTIEKDSVLILLPVAGDLVYTHDQTHRQHVKPGQLLYRHKKKGEHFSVTNPYEGDLINYFEIWITADKENTRQATAVIDFNIDKNRNLLLPLTSSLPAAHANDAIAVSIGQFNGRKEAVYTPANSTKGIFCFAIQGVFEIQGRLVQINDGLALWNETAAIEMEALSNDAIVLILEIQQLP